MKRCVCAVLIAGALLLPTASSTHAVRDSEKVVQLPFSEAKCRALIARGAPFQLGGPDTAEGCVIIIGGMPGGVNPPEPD